MIAAMFSRVSTEKKEQKDSLINQEAILKEAIKARGWAAYPIVYKESKSGTKANRDEINRLLEDAKSGCFQVIVAKELSRLARNVEFSSKIIKQLKRLGVHLVTLDGAIDTTTGNTELAGLYAWIYENESVKMSRRIKAVYASKYKNGEYLASNAPYGYYRKENKLYVRNDETPEIVRRIFRLFLEGKSFSKIARVLYEEDVPTPSQVAGKKKVSVHWHATSVMKILMNRQYTGDLEQGRETTVDIFSYERDNIPIDEWCIVTNTHEAIVSKDDFQLAQELIAKRRRPAQSNDGVKTRPHEIIHLFTEVLTCSRCGKNYHYRNKGESYVCGGYNRYGSKQCEPGVVSEVALAKTILEDLRQFSSSVRDDSFIKSLQKEAKRSLEVMKVKNKANKEKLRLIDDRRAKAVEQLIDGTLDKEGYTLYVSSSELEKARLEGEIKANQLELEKSLADDIQVIDKLKVFVDEALSFGELTRGTLNRFIDKITVGAEGVVTIHYKFASISNYKKS